MGERENESEERGESPVPQASHSPDFRSVRCGPLYSFSAAQAACIKVLWNAWKNGTPEVGDATILEAAESETARLSDVFRGHPAWGSMIVPGSTKSGGANWDRRFADKNLALRSKIRRKTHSLWLGLGPKIRSQCWPKWLATNPQRR